MWQHLHVTLRYVSPEFSWGLFSFINEGTSIQQYVITRTVYLYMAVYKIYMHLFTQSTKVNLIILTC